MRVPNPSPTLNKMFASVGRGILSGIGVGVGRKAPEAFPDSYITLDTFQSAILPEFRSFPQQISKIQFELLAPKTSFCYVHNTFFANESRLLPQKQEKLNEKKEKCN